MTVRVHYRASELSDGATESFHEADAFGIMSDNSIQLRKMNQARDAYEIVGTIHPERWQSVVIVSNEERAHT